MKRRGCLHFRPSPLSGSRIAFTLRISNAVSPRREYYTQSVPAHWQERGIINPTQTFRCRFFESEFKFAKFDSQRQRS